MKNSRLADSVNLGGALQPRNPASVNSSGASLPVRTQYVRKHLAWIAALLACFAPAAIAATGASVTLAWNPNPESDIAGYRLSYGTSSGQHPNTINVGTNPTATVSGLVEGSTYYFVVTAVNQTGLQSPASSEVSHLVTPDNSVPPMGWTLHYVDSQEALDASADLAFDGNVETMWHSAWRNSSSTPPPHEIQINLGAIQNINGFTYVPRQDASLNGNVGQYEFFVSMNGADWGSPVAAGTFANSKTIKEVTFTAKTGKFIRLRSLSSANGGNDCSIAEISPLFAANGIPTNQAPTAITGTATTTEDSPITVTLTASDPESDPLTYSVVTGPSSGALTGTAPNLTYTPTANFSGNDSFTFRVNDGTVDSASATVSMTITPVNDTPVAVAKSVTTAEEASVGILLTGTDAEASALTFTVASNPTKGTLSGTAPNLTYTPTANASGSDSFTFRVNDGTVDSTTATVSITINPVNDAPVAVAKSVTTAEEAAVGILLTGTDAESSALTFTVASNPTKGTLSGTAPNLTYTPTANASGSDSFTFRVNDGTVDSSNATVSITITPVNDAPVALAKSVTTAEDTAVGILLTGTDAEASPLTFTVATNPTKGTLSGTAPNLTYTPTANATGSDSFTFRVNDGTVDSTEASVSISITPVNDAPVAVAKFVTTAEDAPVAVALTGTDAEASTLTFTVVTNPTKGTLSGTAPNLTYTPTANASGSDSFTFRVNDGTVDSTNATVSITITPVNDAPVALAKSVTTAEDAPVAVALAGTDAEASALTFTVVANPTKGTLSGTAPNLTYTPTANTSGSDSFTYRVNDGTVDSAEATVSITITPVNDAPVAVAKSVTTAEEAPVLVVLTGTDAEASTLSYTVASNPTKGTLSGTPPNLTFTPSADAAGSDSFTFRVNDGTVDSTNATVSITITPVNDVPVALARSITTAKNIALPVTLTGTDKDADILTFSVLSNPSNGVLSGTAPNLIFTPANNFTGTDSFTFLVNDGTVNSTAATITVNVTTSNAAPVAMAQSVTTLEDTPTVLILGGSDSDGDTLDITVLTNPSKGTLSGTPPNLTFTPTTNASGSDSFTFRVSDGSLTSASATVAISITPMNDIPLASAKSLATEQETPALVVLSGSDAEGSALTFAIAAGPAFGTLSGIAPNVTYVPNLGFHGSDSFTYRVNDGTVDSALATVSITVSEFVPPTQVTLVSRTGWTLKYVDSEESQGYPATSAFDGKPETFWHTQWRAGSLPPPHEIQINLGSLQSVVGFRYFPRQDQSINGNIAQYEFYVSMDGSNWGTPVATGGFINSPLEKEVLFTAKTGRFIRLRAMTEVAGAVHTTIAELNLLSGGTVNQPPVAVAQAVSTPEDSPLQIQLTGSDPENAALGYSITTNPGHGQLTGTPPNLTYIPDPSFSGTDQLSFRTNDGAVDSPAATVSITVTPVEIVIGNVPPVFAADPISNSAIEDQTFSGQLVATDANSADTLTFSKLSGPSWLGVSPTGELSGIPSNANVGTNSFSVRVSDNSNAFATAVLNISVANRNDAPVFVLKNFILPDGTEQAAYSDDSLTGAASDTDQDDSIAYSKTSGPRWLAIATNGVISGTPHIGTAGINHFTIRATDRAGAFTEANVQIQVKAKSLPLPWKVDHVGRGNIEGSASYQAGTFTVAGAGALTPTADSGAFGWQTLSGDGQISVLVSQLDDTGSDTRVGVMIRGSLAPDSRQVFVGVDGDGKYQWLQRAKTGGKTSKSTEKRQKGEKMWLRLVRKNDSVTAFKSHNGKKWIEIGQSSLDLPKTCYIGLSVSSGNKEKLNTSKFSHVRVTQ